MTQELSTLTDQQLWRLIESAVRRASDESVSINPSLHRLPLGAGGTDVGATERQVQKLDEEFRRRFGRSAFDAEL